MKKYTLTEKQLEFIVNTTVHNTIKECKKLSESFLDEHDGEVIKESDYDHEEMWENICDIIELDLYNENDDYERDLYISKPKLRDYFDDQVKYEYEHNHVNINPDSFEEFLDYCTDKKMWNVSEYQENEFYDNDGNWDPIEDDYEDFDINEDDEDMDLDENIEDVEVSDLYHEVVDAMIKRSRRTLNFVRNDGEPVILDTIDPYTDDNISIDKLKIEDDDIYIYTSEGQVLPLKTTITDEDDLDTLLDLIQDAI